MRKLLVASLVVFYGCGDDGDFEFPFPTPSPVPTATMPPDPIVTPTPVPTSPPVNPVCNGEQRVPDGPGGFLWKPVSESDGKVAVHFPGKFQVPFSQVTMTRKDGKKESFRYVGKGNPDSQGERQLFRGAYPGSQYMKGAFVEAVNGDNLCRWKIGTPGQRID